MLYLEYAKKRLAAFLAEVERLAEAEFPYSHSKDALQQIRGLFLRKLSRLEQFHQQSDPGVVKHECTLALSALFNYVPLAGFVLRSTNVRNAFEVFAPLLRLAQDILETNVPKDQRKTRLVLSSEWDYSPFVYPVIPDLTGFVLIGLPAPESSNPLLIPLAGHELGHSLWAVLSLGTSIIPDARREIVSVIQRRWDKYKEVLPHVDINQDTLGSDMFAIESWQPAERWVLAQAEESFCDFVGVRIFGSSFLHAFAYLLSPNIGARIPSYPGMLERVANLHNAASQFGIKVPSGYADIYEGDALVGFTRSDEFLVSVADEVLKKLVPRLLSEADTKIRDSGIELPSQDEVTRINLRFKRVVPAEGCKRLSDILNAGWQAWSDPDLWKDMPEVNEDKDEILKELVLKNIELFEIEQMISERP